MNQQQEINILDLLWNVLKYWRFILVCALVGTVLVSGYKYFSDYSKYKEVVNKDDVQEVVSASNNLSAEDKQYVDMLITVEKSIAKEQKNLARPIDDKLYRIEYLVSCDNDIAIDANSSKASSIATIFVEHLSSEDSYEYIARELGVDVVDLKDKIHYTNSNGRVTIDFAEGDIDLNKASELVQELVDKKNKELSASVDYKISRVLNNEIINDSESVIEDRNKSFATLSSSMTSYETLKKALTENQTAYYNSVVKADVNQSKENSAKTSVAKPSFSVRYALIGFLAGLVLAVAMLVVRMLTRNIMMSQSTFIESDIRLYGLLRLKGKKSFWRRDGKVTDLQFHKQKTFSTEDQLNKLVENVMIDCENTESKNLCILSTAVGSFKKPEIITFIEKIESKGISVMKTSGLEKRPKDLKKILDNESKVVFVEIVSNTRNDDIYAEYKLLNEYGVDILGGICAYEV